VLSWQARSFSILPFSLLVSSVRERLHQPAEIAAQDRLDRSTAMQSLPRCQQLARSRAPESFRAPPQDAQA
jgi:hypothetical protein